MEEIGIDGYENVPVCAIQFNKKWIVSRCYRQVYVSELFTQFMIRNIWGDSFKLHYCWSEDRDDPDLMQFNSKREAIDFLNAKRVWLVEGF